MRKEIKNLTDWKMNLRKSPINQNKMKTRIISYVKQISSPGSMHDTGCSGLMHWDDPEGWYGGGGRWEGGSGWGTRVYPWRIHVDVWQNQYNKKKEENIWKIENQNRKLIIWIKRIPERKQKKRENRGEELINKTQTNFLKQKADFPGCKSPQSSSQNKEVNIRK